MSVAGACEWCGGPQRWTIHAGEVLVSCVLGCLPLFEVVVPFPDSEVDEEEDAITRELTRGWRVGPPEGSETKASDGEDCELPF